MNNAAAAIDNGRRAARSLAVAAAGRRAGTAARRCARDIVAQRGTEAFPRKQERDESNRIKNRSDGGGIERDGHSDLTGARRGRVRGVSLPEPVVVDAHRLE